MKPQRSQRSQSSRRGRSATSLRTLRALRSDSFASLSTGAARGFSLLEVVFAVTIVAVALIGLQATVSGSILAAGDSINRRAARELARAKLEEIIAQAAAGRDEADGSGSFEEYPEFNWSSRSDEVTVGAEGSTATVRVVLLELTFPVEASEAGGEGRDTIKLASVLPEPQRAGAAPGAPR